MKSQQRNPIIPWPALVAMLLSSALLGACGSSSSSGGSDTTAGIGGTGIVVGKVTGFGSIWVNGRRFETTGSRIIFDGESGTEDDLKIGMVVKIDAETKNGMFAGTAIRVEFDDEIEGPINGVPVEVGGAGSGVKRFAILAQNVTIDATRTIFDATDFASIDDGDVVEVSGFRIGHDEVVATYVRKTGEIGDPPPIEVELRGTIENNVAGVSFEINGVTVNYAGASKIDVDGGAPMNGMFVEVEGIFVTHTAVNAVEIEQEDENFGDNVDDISLHGIVSQYDPNGAGLADFLVNGQRVDASTADLEPANLGSLMQNGLEVEVEGEIVGGVLIAEELELRDGDTEVRATVVAKDVPSGTFIVDFPLVGQVTVATGGLTVFEDESASALPNFSFDLLMIGDFVEVEGTETNDTLNAQVVKRREPNDLKLQGAVDQIDPLNSLTILGLTYPVDPGAEYQGGALNANDFFALVQIGDIVELEDDEPDGDADEVEFED